MITNEGAVVLSRRNLGESDRLCSVYTERLGKVAVRFIGVNKPRRKLKALSEPMMWSEFRLYTSPRTEIAKCVGGAIISCFPDLRGDLDAMVQGLSCCERLDALTPLRDPSPQKYRLICSALAALDAKVSPWVPAAFGLHLLELSGHSLREREVGDEHGALWRRLHETDLDALAAVPWRAETGERVLRAVDDEIEAITSRPLKSRDYAKRLAGVPEGVHA